MSRVRVYLQRRVKNDQLGAGWNGIVAGVVHHELQVDVGIRICGSVCKGGAEGGHPATGPSVCLSGLTHRHSSPSAYCDGAETKTNPVGGVHTDM